MNNRERIFLKQKGKCVICGSELHLDKSKSNDNFYLQIDHITPKSLGGKSHIDNYRGLCRPCNASRRNISGQRLINVIITKQLEALLDKYAIRLMDELNIRAITVDDLIRLESVLKQNYEDNLKLIRFMKSHSEENK